MIHSLSIILSCVYELNDVDLIFSLYVVYILRRYHLLSFYSIYALDS